MAELSKKGLLEININNKIITGLVEWQELSILATFDDNGIQANISTNQLTAVNELAEIISNWVEAGKTGGVGIFEGIPAKLNVYNENNNYNAFKGYINLTEDFEDSIDYDGRIKFKIEKKGGLNILDKRLRALSYGYLEDIGVYGNSDYTTLEYVVEKKNNAFEILVTSITLYLMIKELAESARTTADVISETSAFFATGATGGIAASIYAVAKAIAAVAYTSILLVAVIDLVSKLIQTFISPVRNHKVISFHLLLLKVAGYLGYSFNTSIGDLLNYYYLPSNINLDDIDKRGFISKTKGTQKGIPNASDPGYSVSEMFRIIGDMFNAKFAIINNTLEFHNVDSDYWVRQSTFKMSNPLEKAKKRNTDELEANRLFSFSTDINDEWTIDNFKGTNFEIITDAVTVINQDAKYISGLDPDGNIPLALGNRKESLNALEKTIAELGGAADALTGVLGGGTKFKNKVKNRIGTLKVSKNETTVPKVIYLQNNKIPTNHRNNLSARYLVENYHYGKSFIQRNYFGQKIRYENVNVPFGFEDFLKVIENSYFYDFENKQSKIISIDYNVSKDTAKLSWWKREIYTKNLKETFIEPE